MSFEAGFYEIVNVENGKINAQGQINPQGELEFQDGTIPVVASPQSLTWMVAPRTDSDPGVIEVNIFKQSQPANVYRDGTHEDDHLPGIVAIRLSENSNVWRLHKVFGDVYLIYFSRQGYQKIEIENFPSRLSHWRLPSSLEGTKVVVETNEKHPVNELLKPYLLGEISLEEFEIKLTELHKQVPECFWEFRQK